MTTMWSASLMWLHRILAVALVGVVAVVAPFAAPAAAAECTDPGQDITTVPWAQQNLGASDVWALTRGGGITVAVLESGVDAAHPQLSGRVAAGVDAVAGTGPANTDCVGTGTQVAGVIAGKVTNGIGFTGVAPLARILPVRVVADRQTGGAQAAQLAKGINAAVDAGADVIDVAVPTYTDDPAVRAAVQKALGKQIVVVAAVGDLGGANQQNPTPYPAAYDGVIGVGAVDERGIRVDSSQFGEYVDLVAPGGNILTLQRASGLTVVNGTGVASGFVSAVVALVRAFVPRADVAEVTRRLTGTAVPAAGGPGSQFYGHGIVNPAGALSDQVVEQPPAVIGPVDGPAPARASIWAGSRRWALIGTAGALGLAVVIAVLAVALPQGRRRRWRAEHPAPARVRDEPEEPGPPAMLFD
ncbi:S8 family serine peptidase [Dactylosporangium cerinum]|uniref:S8 family serine peptidase n=2 Tax=Dactylosporangium cerinum TaxID=1434730 RepID=A0ABV9WJD4_9ACTN